VAGYHGRLGREEHARQASRHKLRQDNVAEVRVAVIKGKKDGGAAADRSMATGNEPAGVEHLAASTDLVELAAKISKRMEYAPPGMVIVNRRWITGDDRQNSVIADDVDAAHALYFLRAAKNLRVESSVCRTVEGDESTLCADPG
jgi:hypothetical protein